MKKLLKLRSNEAGFTLIEIMIVVLIIGILLAIAVPNFVKARETSRTKSCIANLTQINSAKEQWAMDNNKADGATVTMADIAGGNTYLRSAPACPSSGTYTVNVIGTSPTCSVSG